MLFSVQRPALAAIELSYSLTSASPSALKSASAFSSSEGTFSSTTSDPVNPLSGFDDLYVAGSISSDRSSWGMYYRKCLEATAQYTGKNSAGTTLMTKTSALDAWLVGFVRKYYWNSRETKALNGFLELQFAGGKANYNQTIVDSTATTHSISGSAFVLETNAYVGLQTPLWGQLEGLVKLGYARMHSNYFTVDSVSGFRYGSLIAGDRMAVRNGEDVRLVRDGFSFQLGLSFGY